MSISLLDRPEGTSAKNGKPETARSACRVELGKSPFHNGSLGRLRGTQ